MKGRRRAACTRRLRATARRTSSIAREESRARGYRIAGTPAARARHIAASPDRVAREPPRGSFPCGLRRLRRALSTRAGVAGSQSQWQHSSDCPPSRLSEAHATGISVGSVSKCPSNARLASHARAPGPGGQWRAAAGSAGERCYPERATAGYRSACPPSSGSHRLVRAESIVSGRVNFAAKFPRMAGSD